MVKYKKVFTICRLPFPLVLVVRSHDERSVMDT